MAMGIAIFSAAPRLPGANRRSAPERQGGGPPSARPLSPPASVVGNRPRARLSLARLDECFFLGMDELGQKLAREGIPASVRNHVEQQEIVAEIAARSRAGDRRPIILVGIRSAPMPSC